MKSKLLLTLALLSCSIILSNCGCCGKKNEPKEEVAQEVTPEVLQQEVANPEVEQKATAPAEK